MIPRPDASTMNATKPQPSQAGASAPPQKAAKAKRTFTPANFLKTVGNVVIFEECRPMSKDKRWRLVKIVK